MKSWPLFLAVLLSADGAMAASIVSYSASDSPAAAPDSGSVNVWSTSTTGGSAGFFQGNSAGNGGAAGAGSSAWAMYANSGSEAFATHVFAGGALTSGQGMSLQFDNGGIATGKSAGIQLFSGGNLVFAFYFTGGEQKYRFLDHAVFDQDTSEGFTTDGGVFSFTLTGESTYAASFRSASWTGTLNSIFSHPIDSIQVYNNSAGGGSGSDVFFNNLSIVPEPANALIAVLLAAAMLRRRGFVR